jgi:hypothetical protein
MRAGRTITFRILAPIRQVTAEKLASLKQINLRRKWHMQEQRAHEILLHLVNGVDPSTQQELPSGTVLDRPEVVRALLIGSTAIGEKVARASRRAQLGNIGKTWSSDEIKRLLDAFQSGEGLPEIAVRHGRTVRAIESRLEKLGVITADQRTTVDRFGSSGGDS